MLLCCTETDQAVGNEGICVCFCVHVEQQIRERPSISVFRWVHLLTEVHVKKKEKKKTG